MLIKLTPAASTPTILFALAFPDLPPTIPVPAAWVAQLTRLSADDLEAPPSLHALDRAAALPSLLQEVLFDLPSRRISCTFLDGAAEDWELDKRCAEMLARVIGDVEESGRAEERSREWAEAERVRAEIERPAPVDVKDKVEEPSLPVKGGKTKGGLHRSRSLLHALVATFSSRPQMSASAPTARSSFARRASFSALSTAARADKDKARTSCPHPRPVSPSPPQNLQSPAPASGSTFAAQQKRSSTLSQTKALSPGPSPRTLRRRARSTLVDTFRLHVLPVLSARVGLFERAASGSSAAAASVGEGTQRSPGGGYHAWVARSMLRRAEARMRELEGAWPALAQRVRSPRSAGSSGVSPTWPPDEPAFGLPSPTWPTSPGATFEPWSSDSESDSEDEQGAEDDTDYDPYSDDGPETPGGDGESVSTDSDGSSVHTPESGHSIPYGASLPGNRGQEGQAHPAESLASTTSSYFTCEAELSAATASYKTASEHATHAATPAQRLARREAKRARRAARTEHEAFGRMTARLRGLLTQGAAARELAGMQCEEGERVREVRAARRGWLDGNYKRAAGMARVQVRVFRPSGLRGAWGPGDVSELEVADEGGGQSASHGREHGDSPPAYEDVVAQGFPPANGTLRVGGHPMSRGVHRKRSISRMLVHHHLELDVVDLELGAAGLDIDSVGVGLEHLEIDVDAMGLDIDDLEGEAEFRSVDVFAGVSNKAGRSRAAGRVPVNVGGKGRREVWEQRRVVAV